MSSRKHSLHVLFRPSPLIPRCVYVHSTNSSQFFVTLRPCPHLKGKHVVLGRVVKGFETIVAISKMPVDAKDRPLELITIQHCGELERKAGKLGNDLIYFTAVTRYAKG